MARRSRRRKGKGSRSAQPNTVHPDAAGLDVGATAVYAAVRAERDPDPIRNFSTFTGDLHALANWLKECQVTTVAMESTGVYWIPVHQILEAHGFDVVLVNARHVHSVPGRKSDMADCEWLRYLHSVGLLRGSFRPADEVCAVRARLRHRDNLIKTAARSVSHMQKAYNQMNIHLHHAISDLTGVTGLAITDAILDGQRDPTRLADLADRRIRASRATLIAALQGDWRPEHLFTLGHARATYAHYQQLIAECDQEIEASIRSFSPPDEPPNETEDAAEPAADVTPPSDESDAEPFNMQEHLSSLFGADLTLIPGIGVSTALVLFTELGPDLARFPTAAQFSSWLNLCPHNKITGGKIISSHTGPGTNRAAQALRWATQSLYRSPSSLGQHFRRMRARLGTPEAITATAHKLARIIYHLITHRVAYDDSILATQERQDLRASNAGSEHKPAPSVMNSSRRLPDWLFLRSVISRSRPHCMRPPWRVPGIVRPNRKPPGDPARQPTTRNGNHRIVIVHIPATGLSPGRTRSRGR